MTLLKKFHSPLVKYPTQCQHTKLTDTQILEHQQFQRQLVNVRKAKLFFITSKSCNINIY